MLLTILWIVGGVLLTVLLLALLLVVIAQITQPAECRYARKTTIQAPPERVFAQVNDFHAWQEWSPWAKLDPNCKAKFSGQKSGVGAIFEWDGDKKVGQGKMEIAEQRPYEWIKINLQFIRPFACNNHAEFQFQPEGQQTVVTWTMYGANLLMGKVMALFMNMDKMVGSDFEKGLASLKQIVEGKKG